MNGIIEGASPLGKAPASTENNQHLAMMDIALQRMPQQMDSEKPRAYLPKMPCPTPTYYPQQSPPSADSLEYYLRLQPETLFFVFYYMEVLILTDTRKELMHRPGRTVELEPMLIPLGNNALGKNRKKWLKETYPMILKVSNIDPNYGMG